MARNIAMTWDPAPAAVHPLQVSANGLYLQTPKGEPFMPNIWLGSWPSIQAISFDQFKAFVDEQVERGFNAAFISAVAKDTLRFPSDAGNHFGAPNWKTPGGTVVAPFTTPGDFSTFDNALYIAHLQECLAYAASKVLKDGTLGFLIKLIAPYIGYEMGDPEGWGDEMVADTDAHLFAFGVALANAIEDFDNVIMMAGGDYRPGPGTDIEARMLAFVSGFLSIDNTRLWGFHGDGSTGEAGGDFSFDQPAFYALIPPSKILNTLYWYNEGAKRGRRRIKEARARGTARPNMVSDKSYYNDSATSTRLMLRASTIACLLSGACSMGHAVGGDNDDTPPGWVYLQSLTSTAATTDHQAIHEFITAIPWAAMTPDDAGTFVTAGRGTDGDTVDTFVEVLGSAPCTAIYVPHGAFATNGNITINMAAFTGDGADTPAGNRVLLKIDPTTGAATVLATLATTGTKTIGLSGDYVLGDNASGTGDWLLLVA